MTASSQQGSHAWFFLQPPRPSLNSPCGSHLSALGTALPCLSGYSQDGAQQGADKLSSFQREDQRLKTPALQASLQPNHNVPDTMAGVTFLYKMDTW